QDLRGQPGQLLRPQPHDDLRQQSGESLLQADRAREPQRLGGEPLGQHAGDLFERLVLQQPREQQVARLEQGQVVLVLDLAPRQQPGCFQVEQSRRHDEELAGLVQIPRLAGAGPGGDVGDELVGHLRQRDLGEVELVLGDQAQQQVERAFEVGQVHLERRNGLVVTLRGEDRLGRRRVTQRRAGSHRANTSRASCRYADAPREDGANDVMGSPATVVSGNRTVRPTTVWKTRSPNASTRRASTSRPCTVRESYMVASRPSISRRGLRRSRTFSMVSLSSATPRSAKYSHSSGTTTPSAAVSALTVNNPSDG